MEAPRSGKGRVGGEAHGWVVAGGLKGESAGALVEGHAEGGHVLHTAEISMVVGYIAT